MRIDGAERLPSPLSDLHQDPALRVIDHLGTQDAMALGRVNAHWRRLTVGRAALSEPLQALCCPGRAAAVYRRAAQAPLDAEEVRQARLGAPSPLRLAASMGDARLFACLLGCRMDHPGLYEALARLGDYPEAVGALLAYGAAAEPPVPPPESALQAAATWHREKMAKACVAGSGWSDAALYGAALRANGNDDKGTAKVFVWSITPPFCKARSEEPDALLPPAASSISHVHVRQHGPPPRSPGARPPHAAPPRG